MKLLIFIGLFGFIFPVCEELNQLQCSSNVDCEWFEDIEYGNCSWFDQDHDACEETLGCYGAYQYPGWYSGWYCAGGQFIIDNGYCQESSLPPLSCEDTNQTEYLIECNGGYMMSDVSWLLNPGDTMGGAPYAQYICLSDDDYQLTMANAGGNGWNGNTWSLYKTDIDGDLVAQCTLDSGSYDDCFFTIGTPAPPESCEESNQTECENDDTCEWVNNTTIGDCGNILSPEDCNSSLFCFWGNGGGGNCFGGIYEEDNGYCEESSLPPLSCEDTNQTEYLIECDGGEYQNEVSWILDPGDTMGGAPYSQHICLSDDDYQLTMTDSWGDGWNGNTWSLYKGDFDGDLVAQCTLDSGSYDDCFFTIGTPAPPESCEESNQTECENDDTCNWVINTTIGSCSGLSSQECNTVPDCNWACTQWGSWYTWICYGSYYCSGGNYFIDSSYCEDIDFIEGDLNQDLIVNILDIIIIVDIILNQESNDSADINGDGTVNILDIIELVDIIINV